MIVAEVREAYWAVVADCLEELHGRTASDAADLVARFRGRIADAPIPGYIPDLIYHAEPFHLAEDLAGRSLDPVVLREQYERVLARHFGA